jgi:hypothetical protein
VVVVPAKDRSELIETWCQRFSATKRNSVPATDVSSSSKKVTSRTGWRQRPKR